MRCFASFCFSSSPADTMSLKIPQVSVRMAIPKTNTRKNAIRFPKNPSNQYASQKTDPPVTSDQLFVVPINHPHLFSGLNAV